MITGGSIFAEYYPLGNLINMYISTKEALKLSLIEGDHKDSWIGDRYD
jgi:hypothetical protein